jgi:hypothetical protein
MTWGSAVHPSPTNTCMRPSGARAAGSTMESMIAARLSRLHNEPSVTKGLVMAGSLNAKTAVITGSSRGIGKGIA